MGQIHSDTDLRPSIEIDAVWLGNVVVRALDLQSTGSTPGHRIAE